MFTEFVTDRIEEASKPLSDVIKTTNLYTFSNTPPADLKKGADKLGSAKANAAPVTKLFLSLKARPEAGIDAFFEHENQRKPPSLSDRGKLRQGTKTDIIACLPGMPAPGRSKVVTEATVVILDMAAVIHIIKLQQSGTHTKRRVSSHKLVPIGVRLQVVEHESLPRYLSPRVSNGRSSSKITKITNNQSITSRNSWDLNVAKCYPSSMPSQGAT